MPDTAKVTVELTREQLSLLMDVVGNYGEDVNDRHGELDEEDIEERADLDKLGEEITDLHMTLLRASMS